LLYHARGAHLHLSLSPLETISSHIDPPDINNTGFPEERRGCRGWVQGKRYRQSVQRRR
jgi:hypothetical protein